MAKMKRQMMALMRVKMAVKMAAQDGKITRMELRTIVMRSMGRLNTMAILKQIKKTDASRPKMASMLVMMLVERIRDKRKNGNGNGDKDKGKGKGNGDKDNGDNVGYPGPNYPEDEEEQEEDIEEADDADSKYYRMFDYGKELTKAAERVRDKDKKAREEHKGAEKLLSADQKKTRIGKISMMTGSDLSRISTTGKLQLKKGQVKAMAPNYEMLKKDLKSVESPYSNLLKKIGSETGVQYGDEARKARSQARLSMLGGRLTSNSPSPFGMSDTKKSGYGDAGTDLIKKFSMAKSLNGTRMMMQQGRNV